PHVDEGDIRSQLRGERNRLGRGPGRADDLETGLAADEIAHRIAQGLLVLRHEDAHGTDERHLGRVLVGPERITATPTRRGGETTGRRRHRPIARSGGWRYRSRIG